MQVTLHVGNSAEHGPIVDDVLVIDEFQRNYHAAEAPRDRGEQKEKVQIPVDDQDAAMAAS